MVKKDIFEVVFEFLFEDTLIGFVLSILSFFGLIWLSYFAVDKVLFSHFPHDYPLTKVALVLNKDTYTPPNKSIQEEITVQIGNKRYLITLNDHTLWATLIPYDRVLVGFGGLAIERIKFESIDECLGCEANGF